MLPFSEACPTGRPAMLINAMGMGIFRESMSCFNHKLDLIKTKIHEAHFKEYVHLVRPFSFSANSLFKSIP